MTSKYLPSFLPAERYARPRLPSGGSLGLHFPTFYGTTLGYDYLVSFSIPFAFARPSIPCLFLFVCVLSSSSSTLRNFCVNTWPAWSPGTPFPGVLQGNNWFSQVPANAMRSRYPPELMPCSSNPVVSSALAFAHSGLLPSATMTTSVFPQKKTGGYPHGPRLYKFRGSITRPVFLLPSASDFRYRIYLRGSLLPCWLDSSRVGLSPTG